MSDRAGSHQYNVTTWWKRLVAEYAGISLFDVQRLNYLQYLTLRRDAFIYRWSQTEAGREYLDNAWRMEQTSPDRAALRKQFGKGDHHGE